MQEPVAGPHTVDEILATMRPEPEPIILDPDAAEKRLMDAMTWLVQAAIKVCASAPYGILPDPAHMSVLRDSVKRYELAVVEVETTAALIQLAGQQEEKAVEVQEENAEAARGDVEWPKDIQTEGL